MMRTKLLIGSLFLKNAIVTTYIFFLTLSLVSYNSALGANNESFQRGLWLSLGDDEYVINGSEDWDREVISGQNSTFLFVEQALFLQASQDVGIRIASLKKLDTKDTKKIVSKVFELLNANYTCSAIYVNAERTVKAGEHSNVLVDYLENNDFPLKNNGIPQRALEVALSVYYVHPKENYIASAAFLVILLTLIYNRVYSQQKTRKDSKIIKLV